MLPGRAAQRRLIAFARFAIASMMLTSVVIIPARAQPSLADEYAVKAAFLYKFGLFVQWPTTAFSSPGSAVNLCIVGENPFGNSLDTVVAGQQINGRDVVIRRMQTVEPGSSCHILYVGGSKEQSKAEIIDTVRGHPVLTVTDGPTSTPGIIHFVLANNHIHFDIDDDAAAQNELVISSQLMNLALNIKRRSIEEE
jgi:hypothetical protein